MDFSVIIPAYNCEKTILQTVESIEAVECDSMELILIDDGSTDSTGEVCKQIAKKYPNVRCYHQENKGVSAARNYGIQQANGTYILFCDADDTVDPTLLRKCLQKAIEKDADMLIFGIVFHHSYHGSFLGEEYLKCDHEALLCTSDFADNIAYLYDINYLSSVWNKLLKRTLCEKVCFNTSKKIFEDLLYVLEYLDYCESIVLMPDLAYIYQITLPIKNPSKTKCIDDFNVYMKEFQDAVLNLEDYLATDLPELRKRIVRVYELILQDKLNNSSYQELKELDHSRLLVTLFGEVCVPSTKILQLFFDHRFVTLKIYCYYREFINAIKLKLKG